MAINLASLRKLETLPASAQAKEREGGELVAVLVKLRKGMDRPAYITARGEFSATLFSAEIPASDLARLEADPAVESVSLSQRLPVID